MIMGFKATILTSVAIAALGLSLITEGTVAYFNDTETNSNSFTTGLLDLEMNKESIINIGNIVPGDTMNGNFELNNDGTVDIKEVILHSSYEVVDNGEGNNGDDLGEHIVVEYLYNVNGRQRLASQMKLSELKDHPLQIIEGFPAGSTVEKFAVQFKFIDNGEDQTHFQTDELKLKWDLEAVQRDGDPDLK